MLLSAALAVLSLLSVVAPADAHSSSLHRRRCRAHASASGAINVGVNPTSTPDDAPESSSDKPSSTKSASGSKHTSSSSVSGCFPSKNFDMPDDPTSIDVGNWWCSRSDEYAFLGFGYAVDACPSKSSMAKAFQQMKSDYNARYVRLYGACDNKGFNSDVIDAAYQAGVGVFALVWFGFDGSDKWKSRLSSLLSDINSNPRAPYVVRDITLGSEALYDNAISASSLVSNVNKIRDQVPSSIQVATSDMAYKFSANTNVLGNIDNVQLSLLPFFSGSATVGSAAKSNVLGDLKQMANATNNKKKIIMAETGWPSNQNVWKANSKSAVASVSSEKQYFDLLDDLCSTFKDGPQGGYAWFAHIWDDNSLPGWGITHNGTPKFDFSARTSC